MCDSHQDPRHLPIQAFALTPGRGNPVEVLNYMQSAAVKLFNKATAKLEPDFDMKPKGLKYFLFTLQNRASTYGWEDILMIPGDAALPHINLRSLTREYIRMDLEQVRKSGILRQSLLIIQHILHKMMKC